MQNQFDTTKHSFASNVAHSASLSDQEMAYIGDELEAFELDAQACTTQVHDMTQNRSIVNGFQSFAGTSPSQGCPRNCG